MTRNPVPDHSREFSDLQIEATIFPRRDAQGIFIGPPLFTQIGRIESGIDPALHEEVYVGPNLGIEENAQSRGKKVMSIRADQARRRVGKIIVFEIEQPADPRPHLIVESADRQDLINLIEETLGAQCRGDGGEQQSANQIRFHDAMPLGRAAGTGAQNTALNSVHSAFDLTSRSSPPCNRINSRARFRPSPCPGTSSPASAR